MEWKDRALKLVLVAPCLAHLGMDKRPITPAPASRQPWTASVRGFYGSGTGAHCTGGIQRAMGRQFLSRELSTPWSTTGGIV